MLFSFGGGSVKRRGSGLKPNLPAEDEGWEAAMGIKGEERDHSPAEDEGWEAAIARVRGQGQG